ncbi:MAG: S8 family serine peptidase, partial [Proteobacteria bacterium]|nr:S8 family serine peptidase [Pseudomonadota bacterium]
MLERIKRIFFTALLAAAVLAVQAGAPAIAQAPERIDVLIGFDRAPGPAERAVVTGLGGRVKYSYTIVDAIAANIPAAAVSALLRNPRVVTVEADIEAHAIDAELDNSWGVERIGAGTVHAAANKGAGVKIAVIDTGIDYTHPDLDANYAGGWDFFNNDGDPMDDNGHGTHVAGTIVAEDDGAGVVGVAPDADIYALKVLNENGAGFFSDIIAAVEWTVANGIQVTNNSYGSSRDPGTIVKAAFDNSAAAGVLHIAAAGNSGRANGKGDNVGYPARYASVVAVAATNSNDARASWSSTGPDVELAAPGVGITSTLLGGGYATYSGTSMASPHVAGTAALVIAAGYTGAAAVRTRLQQTADDLGDAGRDNFYGYGLVDADGAAIGPTGDLPPTVSITGPGAGDAVSGMVAITADASDDGSVAQVEFFVDGSSIFIDTASPWSADWDSTSVANASHTITATAKDDAGQTTPDSITVSVDNGGGGGGGGDMYVSAISFTQKTF